jgi:hypothetical protein
MIGTTDGLLVTLLAAMCELDLIVLDQSLLMGSATAMF